MFYQVFLNGDIGNAKFNGTWIPSPGLYDGITLATKGNTLVVEHSNSGYVETESMYGEPTDKIIVTLYLSGSYPQISMTRLRAGEHDVAETFRAAQVSVAILQAKGRAAEAEVEKRRAAEQAARAQTPEAVRARKKLEEIDAKKAENPQWIQDKVFETHKKGKIGAIFSLLGITLIVLGILTVVGVIFSSLQDIGPFIIGIGAIMFITTMPSVYRSVLGSAEDWVGTADGQAIACGTAYLFMCGFTGGIMFVVGPIIALCRTPQGIRKSALKSIEKLRRVAAGEKE